MDPFPFEWEPGQPPAPPAIPGYPEPKWEPQQTAPQEVPRYGKPVGPQHPEPKWGSAPAPVTGAWRARVDVPYDGRSASVRYNNPGAQYPSAHAARFGADGYGIIGGNHKIARFPSEAHGGAANMDNFARGYKGMTFADAVRKWRGGNGALNVPEGFDPNGVIDDAFLGDRERMTRFFDAMSRHEGRKGGSAVSPQTWQQAFDLYRTGASPQITAQGMLPTSTTAAAAPQQGRGMIDGIKNLFSGLAPQQSANPAPVTADDIIARLDGLGVPKDDPMRGQFEFFARSLTGGRQAPPQTTPMQAGFGTFLDVLGAGLGRRGGNSAAAPVLPEMMKMRSAERQKLEERQYQAPLALLQAIMPYRMKEVERQKREATMRAILGGDPPAQVAPGGAQGVQIPQQAPLVPGKVDRAELPPPGASAAERPIAAPPGISVAPPQPITGLPGGVPPSPAATPATQPAAAPGAPAAAPGGAAGAQKYRGAADPALMAEMDRLYPMPDERVVRALTAAGHDKEADNMHKLMELRLKQREQFLKQHEQQRADDPELAGRKTYETEMAKKKVELEHARTVAQQGGKSMIAGVDRLKAVPGWAGDSFEKAIGPFDNWTPFGVPVGPFVSGAATYGNKVTSDEVRSTVKADIRAMMMKAKEMVRGPGEGVWTDADQKNLDEISGDVLGARDTNEYGRRVGNVSSRIYDIYLAPKGIKPEDIGLQPPTALPGAAPGTPGPAPDAAGASQSPPQMTPDRQAAVKQRYEAGDPAMKAAIEKQLRDMGFDPTQVLGTAPSARQPSFVGDLVNGLPTPAAALGNAIGAPIGRAIRPHMPSLAPPKMPPISNMPPSSMEGF